MFPYYVKINEPKEDHLKNVKRGGTHTTQQ